MFSRSTTGPDRLSAFIPHGISILFIVTVLVVQSLGPVFAVGPEQTVADILNSTESFFRAMKDQDRPAAWRSLTETSRTAIVDDTYRSLAKTVIPPPSREEVRRDFDSDGPLARGYWSGFFKRFNPEMALSHSLWEMGPIEGDQAEVRMTYETSDRPAVVRLFRENGSWKVGLVETFWLRKNP